MLSTITCPSVSSPLTVKIARHIIALSIACLVGAFPPVLAILYDALYRYQGSAASAFGSPEWRARFLQSAIFTAAASIFVGLPAGALGVWCLHSLHRTALKHFALSGSGIGAACGALFVGLLHHPGDSPIVWLIFIMLPSISMTLGFIAYWFVCFKRQAA